MDTAMEMERNPVSTRFSLSVEDEQADTGRDGRACLAKPNSQGRTGTGKCYFPCSADQKQDWQPYPVDPYSAISDDHTTQSKYLYNNTRLVHVQQHVQPILSTGHVYLLSEIFTPACVVMVSPGT